MLNLGTPTSRKTCTCTQLSMSRRNLYNVWVYITEGEGRWEELVLNLEEQNVTARRVPRKFLVGREVSWEGLDPDIRKALSPETESPAEPATISATVEEQQDSTQGPEESSLQLNPVKDSFWEQCAKVLRVGLISGFFTVGMRLTETATISAKEIRDSSKDPGEGSLQINPEKDSFWRHCAKVLRGGLTFCFTPVGMLAFVVMLAFALSKYSTLASYIYKYLSFGFSNMDQMDFMDEMGEMDF